MAKTARLEEEARSALPDPKREPTVTVERAAVLYGISRGSAYAAIRRGEIPSIRIGHRLLVPTAAVLRQLGYQP
jgi:excisionase family DNA binding protein